LSDVPGGETAIRQKRPEVERSFVRPEGTASRATRVNLFKKVSETSSDYVDLDVFGYVSIGADDLTGPPSGRGALSPYSTSPTRSPTRGSRSERNTPALSALGNGGELAYAKAVVKGAIVLDVPESTGADISTGATAHRLLGGCQALEAVERECAHPPQNGGVPPPKPTGPPQPIGDIENVGEEDGHIESIAADRLQGHLGGDAGLKRNSRKPPAGEPRDFDIDMPVLTSAAERITTARTKPQVS
jgi:hypothetical protein